MNGTYRVGVWGWRHGKRQWLGPTLEVGVTRVGSLLYFARSFDLQVDFDGTCAVIRGEDVDDRQKYFTMDIIGSPTGGMLVNVQGSRPPAVVEVRQWRASNDTYKQEGHDYYSAGIDVPKTDIRGEPDWHFHAIQFYGKTKEEAEALRDKVLNVMLRDGTDG